MIRRSNQWLQFNIIIIIIILLHMFKLLRECVLYIKSEWDLFESNRESEERTNGKKEYLIRIEQNRRIVCTYSV